MKIVAIHQPHYFPWLGYLDKMAKADEFVVLDEVQLTDGSPMVRNRFLQIDGESKLLSVSVEKKGYLEKRTRDIGLSNWQKTRKKHRSFLECNYRKAPFYGEVMPMLNDVFDKDFEKILDLDMTSIDVMRRAYDISTPIVMQSSLAYDRDAAGKNLVLSLCLASRADAYLSGQGARKYMEDELFESNGIDVLYQNFSYPTYCQYRQDFFTPNLSAVDLLFQCGINGAREIFYSNMQKEEL